jgi:outer membrane protein
MDLFGDTPIVTEVKESLITSDRKSRKDVFAFIESELKAIENDLKAPKANVYGRVDKAAAWALLSRLYLNAEVYTGQERYDDCMTYAKKVINESGYTLASNYKYLFLADNDTNGAQNENIFTANFDGVNSKTWAGTTFLVHAAIGGTMTATDYGVGSGWAGIRTTSALVDKFDGTGNPPTAWTDTRAMFFTNRQSYSISSIASFTDGYAVTKYKNITSRGQKGKDPAGDFVDTDIALIRLGELYLNYAEAALRKNTNTGDALTYVNRLRSRAGEAPLTAARLTVDEVLNERARELYWEGFRRTDLIRYNRFVEGTYLWPFKGGVAAGTAVADFRKLYPIPANVVLASGGVIRQNTGY